MAVTCDFVGLCPRRNRKPQIRELYLCPRGDLNTQIRAFSPVLRLSTQAGEKSRVRGFHALMLAGAPGPVSSGFAGCCPGGGSAIPGLTAARLHSQLGCSRSVTAVGLPSSGRLAALISAPGRPSAQTDDTGGNGRAGVGTRYPPICLAIAPRT
jgi:hypothetical protein